MNFLKIEIKRDGNIHNTKQMVYSSEKEFFTALVTLCDEMGIEVPIWTAYEERILKKNGHLKIDMDDGVVLWFSSHSQ